MSDQPICVHRESGPHWFTNGVPISPPGVKHPVYSWHQCPGPGSALRIGDTPSTVTSADWFNRDDNI